MDEKGEFFVYRNFCLPIFIRQNIRLKTVLPCMARIYFERFTLTNPW